MKLVPFVFTQSNTPTLTKIKLSLFLSHAGKAVWQTDETVLSKEQIQSEYLQPNGFTTNQIWIVNDTCYIEVDTTKTNIASFYTWEEALSLSDKPECWRSFYFFHDTIGANLWTPDEDCEIQGLGSLWNLYMVLRDTVIKK
jgi:hypothetical protein